LADADAEQRKGCARQKRIARSHLLKPE
jgi:hypothetical protein